MTMEKAAILVVEDERDIAELISLHLKREGHTVTLVENGENAVQQVDSQNFDLIIVDWMLPGVSGLDLCKKWRADQESYASKVPIFMVTARAHTSDIVLGLEMGADDYITKPFELPLFLARVRALLRRASLTQGKVADNKVNIGDLSIDTTTYQVNCGKKDIQLTPSEFKLLSSLMKNRGRVLTRERLIDLVQGEGVTVVDRTIDTHVFGLRKKLGKCSDVVETIRGVGYRVKSE